MPELPEGAKFDADKPPLSLLDPLWLLGTAQVLDFGARKYEPYNWKKGILYSRVTSAALRHILAWQDGEDCDPETDLHHLLHATCCLMFLSHYELTGMHFRQFDDRPNNDRPNTAEEEETYITCVHCGFRASRGSMTLNTIPAPACKDLSGCRRRQENA